MILNFIAALAVILPSPVFVHHSTGRNIIQEGHLRQYVDNLWDHDYNYIGLTNPNGTLLGRHWNIPSDNLYPDGLANLFTDQYAARDSILTHEIVILKSCYPTCDIETDLELERLKTYTTEVIEAFRAWPNRLIMCTPPPRHRLATTAAQATRCNALAAWMSTYPCPGNVTIFDLHGLLIDSNGYLAYQWERSHSSDDSHPNTAANLMIAPLLAEVINSTTTGVEEPGNSSQWGTIKAMWR